MPTGPSEKRVLFVRVPEDLYERLRREAFEKGVSLNALVIEILTKGQ